MLKEDGFYVRCKKMTILDCRIKSPLNEQKIFLIASQANYYQSYLLIEHNQKQYNAKSVLSLSVLLGIEGNIKLHAVGFDADEALVALQKAVEHT
jgi:phosphotransferase system HPr-like phosphotransfer protein